MQRQQALACVDMLLDVMECDYRLSFFVLTQIGRKYQFTKIQMMDILQKGLTAEQSGSELNCCVEWIISLNVSKEHCEPRLREIIKIAIDKIFHIEKRLRMNEDSPSAAIRDRIPRLKHHHLRVCVRFFFVLFV